MKQKQGTVNNEPQSNANEEKSSDSGLKWYNPKEYPRIIYGLHWFAKERVYRRLPLTPEYPVRNEINSLANCTAGGQIRIVTDARKLAIRVNLAAPASMDHMAATGQCGFDCYVDQGKGLRYCGTTRFNRDNSEYEHVFFDLPQHQDKKVVLNFPLYQGVKDVWVGVDTDSRVFEPYPFKNNKKAVFYGTSITQGGCASRPGMAYTNILSRKLNMECINLGFSGNGRGEPELARNICTMEDIALIVLDYEANASASGKYLSSLPNFIRILREKHPETPVLLVSQIIFARELLNPETSLRLENLEFQKQLVKELVNQGDRNIHFMDGSNLLGEDFEECTVDGVHATDLGFYRMAENLFGTVSILAKVKN